MNSRGNAFIYILIAVILFGALTFALSSSNEGNDVTDLSEGQTTIAANEILSYAVAAQNTITSLDKLGTSADQIDFIIPSDANFNTGADLNKLFHPEGGGLNYKPLPRDAVDPSVTGAPKTGYYIGRFNNVEWTPTAADDVLFTAYGITTAVCQQLNLKITGSSLIPAMDTGTLSSRLVDVEYHSTSNDEFVVGDCADCEDKPALCVQDSGVNAFYSILVAR